MRLVLLLVLPLLTALVVAFAVANRHVVPLNLWPFRLELQAPLFFLALGGLVLGVLLGFLGAWLGNGGTRRRLRQERERAQRLEAEVARLRHDQALAQGNPAQGNPAHSASPQGNPAPPARPPLRLAGGR